LKGRNSSKIAKKARRYHENSNFFEKRVFLHAKKSFPARQDDLQVALSYRMLWIIIFGGVSMSKRKIMENREQRIVKANALIQKTRFSLSLTEQKIVLYLISKIKPDDNELFLYEFKIKEFCEICGLHEHSGFHYSDLKKTIKELSDKSMWVTLPDGRETLLRWVERPFIEPNNGTVQIKLDNLMMPHLLQLKERFTQYMLYYVLAMRSKYSVRLYELLKSYEYKKHCEFEIEDFKKLMDAENYKQHIDLKRNVLDITMKEINEYSDINITYELIKTGRKFTSIRYNMQLKKGRDERMQTWQKIEQRLNPKQLIESVKEPPIE
jgi:plasmid replication initiation protein